MITAKEALSKYNKLHLHVTNLVNLIDVEIRKVASTQKFYTCIQSDICTSAAVSYHGYKMTELQDQVAARLKEFGYVVTLEKIGAPYVPRGIADDDGNGPEYTNLTLLISWAHADKDDTK